ncbi:MAG: hypothetical protein LBU88_08525, partial [Treponema sp.]|nr:hypothetical protein [Treponema sp.]
MMSKIRIFLFITLVTLFAPGLWGQNEEQFTYDFPPENVRREPGNQELPRSFRELSLGMSLDDLKEKLMLDTYFNFRGDRDVSFLPIREQSLVETTGPSFISRAFFQLRDGNVFIMSFSLNTNIIDHYSVFMQFLVKSGNPTCLVP